MTTPAPTSDETQSDLYCPECGYNLRGIQSVRCPECGQGFDRAALAATRLPWAQRRWLGVVKAYWRTVWMLTVRPGALAAEAAGPTSYRDAHRFRLITVLIAFVPIGAAAVATAMLIPWDQVDQQIEWMSDSVATLPWWFDLALPLKEAAAVPGVAAAGVLLAMLAATAVGSYFFDRRGLDVSRRNRAVALSHYAGAPLAWLPIPTIIISLLVGEILLFNLLLPSSRLLDVPMVIAVLLFLLPFGIWWYATLRLLKETTESGPGRVAVVAILLPVLWVVLAGVIPAALTWSVGFVMLVVESFG